MCEQYQLLQQNFLSGEKRRRLILLREFRTVDAHTCCYTDSLRTEFITIYVVLISKSISKRHYLTKVTKHRGFKTEKNESLNAIRIV